MAEAIYRDLLTIARECKDVYNREVIARGVNLQGESVTGLLANALPYPIDILQRAATIAGIPWRPLRTE